MHKSTRWATVYETRSGTSAGGRNAGSCTTSDDIARERETRDSVRRRGDERKRLLPRVRRRAPGRERRAGVYDAGSRTIGAVEERAKARPRGVGECERASACARDDSQTPRRKKTFVEPSDGDPAARHEAAADRSDQRLAGSTPASPLIVTRQPSPGRACFARASRPPLAVSSLRAARPIARVSPGSGSRR